MKTIKAWAVADKNSELIYIHGQYLIAPSERAAKNMAADNERVVRVTITVEDE